MAASTITGFTSLPSAPAASLTPSIYDNTQQRDVVRVYVVHFFDAIDHQPHIVDALG